MRSKSLKIAAGLVIAGFALGFTGTAGAGESVKNETLVTGSAVPLGEGLVDVEFGMLYSQANAGKRGWWSNSWSHRRRELFQMYEWTFEATLGVEHNGDITISTSWVDMYDREMGKHPNVGNHGRGMDDLTVSAKVRILADRGVSVAYIPGLTIPSGRSTNLSRGRFGPGQNYWSFDQRLAMTQEIGNVTLNTGVGYSLPFGGTRRSYMREYGTHTKWHNWTDRKAAGERGVLESNIGLVHKNPFNFQAIAFNPVVELNYSHRFLSRAIDSALLHATVGAVAVVCGRTRFKAGYQHPVAGQNAARTWRFLLSTAYAF